MAITWKDYLISLAGLFIGLPIAIISQYLGLERPDAFQRAGSLVVVFGILSEIYILGIKHRAPAPDKITFGQVGEIAAFNPRTLVLKIISAAVRRSIKRSIKDTHSNLYS
jgi:hypothetical protein